MFSVAHTSVLSCLALFCCSISLAQTTHHHGVFWGRLVLADRINDRLKWEIYLQKRTQNIPGEKGLFGAPHFSSAWLWFNYAATKNLKVSVSPFGYFDSYIFLTNPADADIPGVKEFRWVVRLEHEQKLKWFNVSNRYSLEYRRRDLQHNNVYQPNWRIRYMLKLEKPVYGILSHDKPVSFYAGDEVFIQFGKAVRNFPNVFDQNRISAGFSLDVWKHTKISVSYLNILQQRISGKDFDDAHALWMVLTLDQLFSRFKGRKPD
ncbi:DUF2490 domain-containing protein [Paraflavitalea sp. CAU 1676]|uniref:DUF2490 domain-containing protein n=1 Tax=Paraflavitalea sp. CAU 1676 TaxID=3032598 RepID=UPI0023D9D67A|nr:DUF2490 domain-containing protein [Paraflavitalea sp. CAU 1676]MDF2190586.1 DUF2490 domain-containing protein [Paraflavitalea sp. CAU 1676]